MLTKRLFLAVSLSAMLVACGPGKEDDNWVDDEQIDLSVETVESDESTLASMPQYGDAIEGESENFDRAFENAPPMIPHRILGMMVIRPDDNRCLFCHLPAKAEEKGATAIPVSHLTSYRPEIIQKDSLYMVNAVENEVVQKNLEGSLNNAQFNCNLCHAPQSDATVSIENLFTPEFRDRLGLTESNLSEVIAEGVK